MEFEDNNMAIPLLNPMDFYPGFPHIAEQIFQKMGKEGLKNCRLLSKSSLECIDNQNHLWKKVIDVQNANQVFQSACNNGFLKMVKFLIQKSEEFKINFNNRSKAFDYQTPFYMACLNGHSKVVIY